MRNSSKPNSSAAGKANKIGVRDVCNCFWDAERSLNLVEWSVNGVHVWPLIRMQIYYALMQDIGIYDAPHPAQKSNAAKPAPDQLTTDVLKKILEVDKRLFRGRSNELFNSKGDDAINTDQFGKITKKLEWSIERIRLQIRRKKGRSDRSLRGKSSAILMTTRKVNGIEPYSKALRAELGHDVILIDRILGEKLTPGALDFDLLRKTFSTEFRNPEDNLITRKDSAVCESVVSFFDGHLGYKPSISIKKIVRIAAAFKAVAKGFHILWMLYPIDTLYVLNAYHIDVRAALAAANALGIKTIELQHGFISEFHLGYSWPDAQEVPYLPDELWCFGDYWHRSATQLSSSTQGRTTGVDFIEDRSKNINVARDPKLVLFTSQGVIGRKLFEVARATAIGRPDKHVVFRLHPSEQLEQYQAKLNSYGEIPSNLELSHRDPLILELLGKADIQVGVFSTTLFEGMSLGARTVVLDMAGADYMKRVVARGDALMVSGTEELIKKLDAAPYAADPSYYYAKPIDRLL